MPTTRFPTELPIVQAPMAGAQDSALAIAVSRAGGLGSLPCAMLSAEALERELQAMRRAGCDRYNLNFFCHRQKSPDATQVAAWRSALAPYYKEFGLDEDAAVDAPARAPFSESMLETIRPYRPAVVSFHFGLPEAAWVDAIKGWGSQVWSSATTVEEARWLADHGADAVIAQGIEAGGHRGLFLSEDISRQSTTKDLLAAIQETISIPVIAAGGIATPGEVAQAIGSGAWAVQIGTAYLCSPQARTSATHRRLLMNGSSPDTAITNVFSGRPARGIMNRAMRELGPMSERAPAFPHAAQALLPLRRAAEAQGLGDFSPLWSGTNTAGCREVDAAEHTRWLANGLFSQAVTQV
jgi:nitronate monooxygenase